MGSGRLDDGAVYEGLLYEGLRSLDEMTIDGRFAAWIQPVDATH